MPSAQLPLREAYEMRPLFFPAEHKAFSCASKGYDAKRFRIQKHRSTGIEQNPKIRHFLSDGHCFAGGRVTVRMQRNEVAIPLTQFPALAIS